MKRSILKSLVPVVLAMIWTGCTPDEVVQNNLTLTSMDDLNVSPSFTFSSIKDITLNLSTNMPNMSASEKVLYSIYDKDPSMGGNLIERVMGDNNTSATVEVNFPSAVDQLYITMRTSFGRQEAKLVSIGSANVNVSFTNASTQNTISARTAAGPNCTSGCGVTLTGTLNNYTLPANTQVCLLQGATMTGNVTFQPGSKLRICGNFTPQNINANSNAKINIVVTETGVFNTNNINMNGSQDTVINFSNNFTLTQSLNMQGYFANYANMTVQQSINVNNGGNFENMTNGNLTVNQSINVNSKLSNWGRISVDKSFHVNGVATALNECRLYIGESLEQNNRFTNNGYVQVLKSTNFSGGSTSTLGAGSLIVTKDLAVNGIVTANTGSYAKVKVSATTRINGGASVTGNLDICDANGIESVNITLPSSVKRDCSSYIASSSCNPGDGVPPVVDTDGDGAPDSMDEYPNDPARAFNSYYPAKDVFGTHAFEDTWPAQADYDFNDLVLGYNYKMVRNAQNKFVEIAARYKMRAWGAAFNNGFAVAFPFASSNVKSVTGTKRGSNYISDNAKGFENGHSNQTVIVMYDAINSIYGVAMRNTDTKYAPFVTDTANVLISFNTPITSIGTAPFNPFLIQNRVRGVEIHMINQAPTQLADLTKLGTNKDKSVPGSGIYYRTSRNLPWAINLPAVFAYPKEYKDILTAHLKFQTWAQSSGASFADWYMDKPTYRNSANIY